MFYLWYNPITFQGCELGVVVVDVRYNDRNIVSGNVNTILKINKCKIKIKRWKADTLFQKGF